MRLLLHNIRQKAKMLAFIQHCFVPACRCCLYAALPLLCLAALYSCSSPSQGDFDVIVSIPPYKAIIEQIAGDSLRVDVIVPPGGSPHAFEPSVRQVLAASKATVWFRIGESFEERAIQAIRSTNATFKVVDLRNGVDLIFSHEGHAHCPHHGCEDPHTWLSPKVMKKQADTIAKTLIGLYPENTKRYQAGLREVEKKLDALDAEIVQILRPMRNRTIVVSHPSYAYFCRDFNLQQVSIEFEGKEPSPQQLTEILKKVKEANPRFIYIQEQHQNKGARLVAKQLGVQVIDIDTLEENYFENMRQIARHFAAQ